MALGLLARYPVTGSVGEAKSITFFFASLASDRMSGMVPDEKGGQAARALASVVALWMSGNVDFSRVVTAATGALVDGLDSPALRDLAGRSRGENRFEMLDLVESAFAELGEPFPNRDDNSITMWKLRLRCGDFLAGAITARNLAIWGHSLFGHGGPEAVQELVLLEDLFESSWRFEPANDADRRELAREIELATAAAQKFLALPFP
ncbi:MAG: hypothetical protein V4479_14800 [Actinomycetota bacterium]